MSNPGVRLREARLWVPLCLTLALASGFIDLRTRQYPEHPVKVYMPPVVAGTAEAPGRYRILVPYLNEGVTQAFLLDRQYVWLGTRLATFFLAYAILFHYLRIWFPVTGAIAGMALVAGGLPLTFTNSWAHPDHIAELALFTLGCLTIARGRDAAFAVTLILATLNRETAVFLVLLHAIAAPFTKARAARTIAFGAIWLAIFVGLRWYFGVEHYEYWQIRRNLEFLKLLPPPYDPYYRAYAWFVVFLFGPLLFVALGGLKAQPMFIRRALWVVPAILIVGFTISSIIETRIFTPMFPLILPAVIGAVYQFEAGKVEAGEAGEAEGGSSGTRAQGA
jgi:hypothetical protein